jgi:hypothetical protein
MLRTRRVWQTTISVLFGAAMIAMTVVPIAWSSATASKNCGSVRGGGATWGVVAAGGVSCGAARPLIRTLAAKPHHSVATRLGTHLGLKCIEYASSSKREIACISTDGRKSVYGITHT